MLEIFTPDIIVFLVISFFAAFVATLAGFGSSTLLVPVAIFFMDLKTAVFVVACFHLFNNIFKVRLFWKKIDFRLFIKFGIPSILFSFIGSKFITVLPTETLTKCLALFLIIFSCFSYFQPHFKIRASLTSALIGGSSSGFLAGLIGLGGAIRSMFLVSFNLPKEIYIGTAAIIAFVVDCTRIPVYLFDGVVRDTRYYQLLPFLFVSAYFGVKFGKNYLNKISQTTFRKIVLIALLLVGLKLITYKG